MYSILIADDELRLCKLISNLIRWDDQELRLIGFVHDGISCLEKIRTQRPDIVISDIRMPGLSGLDVVSSCREEGLDTSFIMLTGYSEFDYAYTAIKKGVVDFLLKPVNADELNQAIGKALNSRGHHALSQGEQRPSEQKFQAEYIMDFFHGHHADHNPRLLPSVLAESQLLPCILNIDKKPEIISGIDNISAQLLKLIRYRFQTEDIGVSTATAANRIFVLFQMQEGGHTRISYCLHGLLDAILETSAIHQVSDITICMGTPITCIDDVSASLYSVTSACNARIICGQNRIIDASQTIFSAEKYQFPKINTSELLRAFNSMEVEASCSILKKLFMAHLPAAENQAHCVYTYSEKFIRFIASEFDRQGEAGLALSLDVDTICNEIPKCHSLEAIIQLMISSLSLKMQELREQIFRADHQVIRVVKQYVDEHYSEALTLTDLGSHVYLNPVYLGNLFKKETGQNFSAYLTSVRMEKAKGLLVNSMHSVSEIAELTGYHDARHFSKIFTKYVGIRPNEYRKYHGKLN